MVIDYSTIKALQNPICPDAIIATLRETKQVANLVEPLYKQIADYERYIYKCEQQIALQKQQIADLKQSTSWRITKPVRIVGKIVKRK